MKKDEELDREAIEECFRWLHKITGSYIETGYYDEAYTAAIYLLANNIVAYGKAHKVNIEQFMQNTFDSIADAAYQVEKEINGAVYQIDKDNEE